MVLKKKEGLFEIKDKYEVLVVGGGGAAGRAAIAAAERGAKTAMIVKGPLGKCGSTAVAFAEIIQYAAADGENDHPDNHFRDTVSAGQGLCDENLARILADEAPARLEDLKRFGAKFDFIAGEPIRQAGFGQKISRGHAPAGRTESTILEALIHRIRKLPIDIYEKTMACSLVTGPDGVCGVLAVDTKNGTIFFFRSPAVVLAAGGGENIYPRTPTTWEITGDAQAMAAKAGAEMVNMEFLQMGPVFFKPNNVIISGPLWRLGPKLTNGRGEAFLQKYLPAGVTPREILDIVEFPFTTRNLGMYLGISVHREILSGGTPLQEGIFFDLTHLSEATLKEKIPYTYSYMRERGVDLARTPAQFTISVQCFHGGAKINEKGETNIKGLYAAGESAGGLRGPDRPAGNALAECQVFGERAGRFAAEMAKDKGHVQESVTRTAAREAAEKLFPGPGGKENPMVLLRRIQRRMFRDAMIVKTEESMARAESELENMKAKDLPQLSRADNILVRSLGVANAFDTALQIIRAAKNRKQSVGGFYREDYPPSV